MCFFYYASCCSGEAVLLAVAAKVTGTHQYAHQIKQGVPNVAGRPASAGLPAGPDRYLVSA